MACTILQLKPAPTRFRARGAKNCRFHQALVFGEIPMSAMILVLFAALWAGLLDVYRAMIGL
jgi:hypothetical protein